MEAVQNETVHNTKSNSAVSCINETNAGELSKEKDELLFDAEEDGEDEDALSDDSLRLRLSDDEDGEQEDVSKNHTNVSEFKSSSNKLEQPSKDIITEENSGSDPQRVVEKAAKLGSEKPMLETLNSAINVPENSALSSDECVSEKKSTKNHAHNSESGAIVISNEKRTSISGKMKSDCNNKEISQVTKKSNAQFDNGDGDNDDERSNSEVKLSDNDSKKKHGVVKSTLNPVEDNDVEITEMNNTCMKDEFVQNIPGNDRLSSDNLAATNDRRNAEETKDGRGKSRETTEEVNCIDTSNYNKSEIADNKDQLINSAQVKSCKDEKSSTNVSNKCNKASNKCNNDSTILNDNPAEQAIPIRLTEINNDDDPKDAIISDILDDISPLSDLNKCRTKNLGYEDKTRIKPQSAQREMNMLTESRSDSSDVIDKRKVVKRDGDVNKSVSEVTDNNSMSAKPSSLASINIKDSEDETDDDTDDTIVQKRKRLKTSDILDNDAERITEEDKQEMKEITGRQKRKSARNAEEIIRKEYLNSDSDSIDSDIDSEKQSVSSYKSSQDGSSSTSSSTSLKRCPDDDDDILYNGAVKKAKMTTKSKQSTANDFTKLTFVEKFCQRNIKEKLPKFTQEQLEELLIQKIVETMTMRSEIGILREQARISERNQEATKTKLQQLAKQVKDFEMVLNRNAADRRTNPDKIITPIKINRSVGLQVNFVTEHGMQNLRQIQQTSQQKATGSSNNISAVAPESSNNTSPRRGIKIRSPRRTEASVVPSTPTISQNSMQTSPLISTVTPAALVVAKPLDSQPLTVSSNSSSSIQQILSGNTQQQQQQIQSQTYVLNGKLPSQINRPNATLINSRSRSNDLIDLTDEEEKSKSAKVNVAPTSTLIEQLSTSVTKPVQCFSRVIQTIPTNVAITTQASIRVVQPNQSTPTATIVNNGTPPRLAYVMQGNTARQLLITSNSTQIRPVTTCRVATSYPAVSYKTGTSTIANGTVRVLSTAAVPSIHINKHPAPLPDTPNYTLTPGWKLPPPAPSLKMSKVPNGIVLSWNMQLTDKYADIASYQLYAYQEVAGVTPSTTLWKKVGDVRALPLPMACTLTQFSEGNNYYFAVRAVDTHSRKGQYSIPGNISL